MNKISDVLKQHYYLLTSILMFLSFPSFDFWFLKGFPFFAWFSLAPLFLYIRGKSMKQVFFYSFVTGIFGNLFAYHWIGNFGAVVPGGYAVVLSFLIPSLTCFFALKIMLAEFLSRRFEGLRFFIYPAAWILIDWAQSLGHLAFPWTYWGYSQFPFTPFIHLASFTGVMGVTFTVVFANYAIADFIAATLRDGIPFRQSCVSRRVRCVAGVLIFVIIVSLYGGGMMLFGPKAGRRDLRVAMVQSCINPWKNWSLNRMHYLYELQKYTRQSLAADPDMVIWSESATLELISYDYATGRLNNFERRLFDIVRSMGRPLLTGEIGRTDDFLNRIAHFSNNAVLISAAGEVVQTYAKMNLVPFGEWFPYENWFPWVKRLVESFGGSTFTPGTEQVRFQVHGKHFGVLVCYEGIFFRFCREYCGRGLDFLVNITNDGWTSTYNGHMQHFATAKFRALENGIWFARAGNTGYTVLIDPYGRITASMPILRQGYCAGDMDFRLNRVTVYSLLGDVFSYGMFIFLGALFGILGYRRLRGRASSPHTFP
ncbi:MAG TPA: apolipoprotein N-acyltransferase [Spirochaetota bacterium]|nr:apolipoprotein N-acyltransferase [Spirochaetota bacterium]